jgi:RND family efflux transporter MFP subunit
MLLQARATRLQALASLEQAKSARDLARISLERMKTLAPAGVAAQQDLDNAAASHAAAAANVRAAQAMIAENDANVRRLMEQKAFARVTAPFDGTITARMIEIGSLVMAGNGAGQELFKLDQSDPVRVLIAVPQGLSPLIHEGMSATVTVRQFPGRSFAGTVKRDARALDVVSRTLPTEVQVPNSDFTLLPGMYAVATLAFDSPRPWVLVDAAALELTADGPKLAVLGPDGLIHFHTVVIDVDYGAQLAISQGITVDDLVVLNPDGHLKEGTPAVAAN